MRSNSPSHAASFVVSLVCVLTLMAISAKQAGANTLRPTQVLVVYDSRIADSVEVAEFYAGSALVPGGSGTEPGVHEGLRVFDLASAGVASTAVNGAVFYDDWIAQYREPIRAHLLANDLDLAIRCIVLCKGLPHRIDDITNPGIGDQPGDFSAHWIGSRAISASVDSELSLLWQDLPEGEIDLFRDVDRGYIQNPYWRQTRPINTYTNKEVRTPKAWVGIQAGRSATTASDDPREVLTPGDVLLVCRLDGHSVADVRAMVTRAQNLVYDTDAVGFVLDESASNGIADPTNNAELDNIMDILSRDDDYETTRDLILSDGRFDPARMFYNADSGVTQFLLGPNVDFGGVGIVVADPIVLLTHYGRNHAGNPGTPIVNQYDESFNLAPGAVFSTMESYNGRAFNGLPTRFNQGQVADFIGAGGTFGIGMVWEPFAQTVPDSQWIARNFILGGLTWAEAAYTAIPAVSWMHVVVGDPLARATRTSDDINGDGVFDVEDLYAFEKTPVDINRDGVADNADRQLLISTFRVPIQETGDAGRR